MANGLYRGRWMWLIVQVLTAWMLACHPSLAGGEGTSDAGSSGTVDSSMASTGESFSSGVGTSDSSVVDTLESTPDKELYEGCGEASSGEACVAGVSCICGECRVACASDAECTGENEVCAVGEVFGLEGCDGATDSKFCTIACRNSWECPRNEVCLEGVCFPQPDACPKLEPITCPKDTYLRLHPDRQTTCHEYTCISPEMAECSDLTCDRVTEFCSLFEPPSPLFASGRCVAIPEACGDLVDCPCLLDEDSYYQYCWLSDDGLMSLIFFAP